MATPSTPRPLRLSIEERDRVVVPLDDPRRILLSLTLNSPEQAELVFNMVIYRKTVTIWLVHSMELEGGWLTVG